MKDQAWLMYGDCETKLREVDDESVNLIFTSPPYAMARVRDYDSVAEEQYVDWFLPKSKEFMRVLAKDGSFVLNIKEGGTGVDGALSDYVMRLILALGQQGWRRNDEYIWVKTNPFPGIYPTRFRNGWERLIHFSRQKDIKIRKHEVMVPMAKSTRNKIKSALAGVEHAHNSPLEPVKWYNGELRLDTGLVFPTNVLEGSSMSGRYRGHPAVFPDWLPRWFIRLLTDKEDVVLDPFAGSGTTGLVALDMQRKTIGIEAKMEYFGLTKYNWNRLLLDGETLKSVLRGYQHENLKQGYSLYEDEEPTKERTLFNTLTEET